MQTRAPARTATRRARTGDVPAIAKLVEAHASDGVLLGKPVVALYEDVQEFWVVDGADGIVGCGALHVLWSDLAEIRTLVVDPACRGRGAGSALVEKLLSVAAELGVRRVFCLTFETAFFTAHGFRPIEGVPVAADVYAELLASYDEGVAEFLDLARVKPNTLGNTRMLRDL